MTFYGSFHLAQTPEGPGVCMHPLQILEERPAEIIAPFASEEDAAEFVEAIMEGQTEVLQEIVGAEVINGDEDDASTAA